MHHAMRQFFKVCGAIHVMHHAHEACMKCIKLVWYFVGGASCKDRCMRLCMKCVVTFQVRHQFLAVFVSCQGCKFMNKYMKTFICNYFKIFYKYIQYFIFFKYFINVYVGLIFICFIIYFFWAANIYST